MRIRRIMMALLPAVALVACGDATDPEGTGRLSVLLTDAPGDVAQATVMIERIELVGGGGPGHLVLRDEPWTGDLTDLTNEFATLVDEAVVPVGSYGQLRFVVPAACIGVEADGAPDAVYDSDAADAVECDGDEAGFLQMPSLAQTGIKVNFQGPIEVTSEQKIVLVDFDVAESFGKLAGGSGRWVMSPVIHGADLTFSGTVNVILELATGVSLPGGVTFEDFTAGLDGETQAFAADGTAAFLFVVPGDLSLDVLPPTGLTLVTTPEVPTDLTLGQQETLDVTITLDDIQS